ncbi:MAG: MBL fold metallo-hydrolase [Anaerolineales bacterium]|nr:MBL fold metallo-hydrolase [Anaerolineales bacterium]
MMTIHIMNCFTCNARPPSTLRTGLVCALVETDQGLVLIDTGPGLEDYAHPTGMLRLFKIVTDIPLNPQEAAVNQVRRLGFRPEDVRHIILTHMHFDHCGGLPDFPWAKVHLHRREFEAFTGPWRRWTDMAYVRRHIAHGPDWALYDDAGERWYDFDAIRLPFEPEMWLVPLHGHTRGLCGVAAKLEQGWFFNASDAGAVSNNVTPAWLIRLVLGPHDGRLRQFLAAHPEVHLTNAHMEPAYFEHPVL